MIDKSKIKRILVITLSNVGDAVLTTPVVEALLGEFPGAKLDVLVGPNAREVFEGHGKISDVILYDKRSPFPEKFRLFTRLRKNRYNLVADLRNTIFPMILGARFITNPFRHGAKRVMHKKDAHLRRLADMGIDVSRARFYIPISGSDAGCAEGLLLPLTGKPFVAIAAGAKSHVKRWPLKSFAELSDMIEEKLGFRVALLGDKNDRIVIERILFYMKTKPLNLIEKTNIPQLAHVIRKSALLITNDSAPLHIGSAVGSRILAFFGPTDEAEYGPMTKGAYRVLKKNLECSPCKAPQCINTGNKYECLKSISVEEAFRTVKELIVCHCERPKGAKQSR